MKYNRGLSGGWRGDHAITKLLERRREGLLDRIWGALKYVIVGMMETIAFASMVGASIFLSSPAGTLAILMGLLVGVLGLAIYEGWRI